MTIINVNETKYIHELEQNANLGGSYTTLRERLQEAQTNQHNLRTCTCGSQEPWVTCPENTPHCG